MAAVPKLVTHSHSETQQTKLSIVRTGRQRYKKLPRQRESHCPSAADIVSYWAIPVSIPDISGLDACTICSRGNPDALYAQPSLQVHCVFVLLDCPPRGPDRFPPNNPQPRNPHPIQRRLSAFLVSKRKIPLRLTASFATPAFPILPFRYRAPSFPSAICRMDKRFPALPAERECSVFFRSSPVTMNFALPPLTTAPSLSPIFLCSQTMSSRSKFR